jgi:hypothetical protein
MNSLIEKLRNKQNQSYQPTNSYEEYLHHSNKKDNIHRIINNS